jgi:hypothetical protein
MKRLKPIEVSSNAGWKFLAGVQIILIVGLGLGLALWLEPQPHSDWAYYWNAAGEPLLYQRGGAGLWLLAIPKAMGASPVTSALMLNLPSAAWLWFLGYRSDGTPWRFFAQMLAVYLLLITPFFGIVQLDLLAAALLGAAFWLLLAPELRLSRKSRVGSAALIVLMAVSTKPQYALILWFLVVMGLAVWRCFRRRLTTGFPLILAGLMAGSVAGFAVDSAMRQASGQAEALRTNSAVTLYSGLLVSSNLKREGCGYWSVEAATAAREDLDQPLSKAITARLAAKPLAYWVSVLECKLPQIFMPSPYALYWLVESPSVRAAIDDNPMRNQIDTRYRMALDLEKLGYAALSILILLACLVTAVRLWPPLPGLALLPVLWVLSYWSVHSVFEIQGRYFMGMLLLAPLLCALVFRNQQFFSAKQFSAS